MILYHGSNVAIDEIDLFKSRPGKDFGKGFYLSADKQQAIEMAESKVAFLGGEDLDMRGIIGIDRVDIAAVGLDDIRLVNILHLPVRLGV